MGTFKTISAGKVISANGEIRLCGKSDGWQQKVELWLLNEKVNANNWRYMNLEEHRKLFAETPILVAYVGDKIGDGHNFDQVMNNDGTVSASFMSDTAERIVGWFKAESDIRIEEADDKQWIVGTGYIWQWYAQELVKKLEKQGLQGMSISIETLIDEMHYEGDVEVFTKYQILGTTILGDDVAPAVKDANIKVLSALGKEEVQKMTLRVASAIENANHNPQKKTSKGVKNMKIKDISDKFSGYSVLGVNGTNVALLSEDGRFCTATVTAENENIVTGEVAEICVNAVFGEGDNAVSINAEKIFEKLNSENAQLKVDLSKAIELKETAETALCAMQKAENSRRIDAVKDAIKNRIAEIKANCGDLKIECDDLLTDEKVSEYASMEKDGKFCGDATAIRDVDARCMSAQLEIKKQEMLKNNSKFDWGMAVGKVAEKDDAQSAIDDILK